MPRCKDRSRSLFVYHRPQHGRREVCQFRSAFIQLQPPHRAVVLQIFGYASLGYPQVFGHAAFQPPRLFASPAPAQQVADADAQRLARLNVIVGVLVGVG